MFRQNMASGTPKPDGSKISNPWILNDSRKTIVKNSSYFWFYVTFLKLGIYNLNRI